jgi:hypothetical protein
MAVYFEGATEGSANDDDGDDLDEVQAEIVALNLTGSSSFGDVNMHLHPSLSALGEMGETVNTTTGILDITPFSTGGTGTADSFFDIYFEIEVDGTTLRTEEPIRWTSLITHKPPAPVDIYESLEQVELVDDAGHSTGILLTAASYQPSFNIVEIDQFEYSSGQIELQLPDGSSERISLGGTSTMAVYFEGTTEGLANDDDDDGLDEVPTEIVALNLTGSSSFGNVNMHLHPLVLASGEMEEASNTTTGILDITPFDSGGTWTVDSFFDVYFEIEIGGMTLRTEEPIRWISDITHKPPAPNDIYQSQEQVELFDEAGNFTGLLLTANEYHPNLCVRCTDFDQSGTTNMPDLKKFASDWLWKESIGDSYNASDLDCNWKVNFFDFAVFASYWLQACP